MYSFRWSSSTWLKTAHSRRAILSPKMANTWPKMDLQVYWCLVSIWIYRYRKVNSEQKVSGAMTQKLVSNMWPNVKIQLAPLWWFWSIYIYMSQWEACEKNFVAKLLMKLSTAVGGGPLASAASSAASWLNRAIQGCRERGSVAFWNTWICSVCKKTGDQNNRTTVSIVCKCAEYDHKIVPPVLLSNCHVHVFYIVPSVFSHRSKISGNKNLRTWRKDSTKFSSSFRLRLPWHVFMGTFSWISPVDVDRAMGWPWLRCCPHGWLLALD